MNISEWLGSTAKYDKKVILTKDIRNVFRLIRNENKAGRMVLNLNGLRYADLAWEMLVKASAASGKAIEFERIDSGESALILLGILREKLKDERVNENYFCHRESLCVETAEEILRVMNIIRSGKAKRPLGKDIKEQQLKGLIEEYESELKRRDLYDDIFLLREAVKEGAGKSGERFAVFKYEKRTALEEDFLKKLGCSTQIDIEVPEKEQKITSGFYESYGKINEIQAVIKEIKEAKLQLGDVNILYASEEYEGLIRNCLMEHGIHCNFLSGRSILEEPGVSLFAAVLGWVLDNYSYRTFRRVADSVIIGQGRAWQRFRDPVIGWGLDRYGEFVQRFKVDKNAYETLLNNEHLMAPVPADSDKKTEFQEEIDQFCKLLQGFYEAFKTFEPMTDIGGIYDGILKLMEQFMADPKDKRHLAPLKDLQKEMKYAGNAASFSEAASFIRNRILSLRSKDDEAADAVTAMRMENVEVLERPCQFILGLSYDSFTVKSADSPVLTDEALTELLDESAGYVEQKLKVNQEKEENLYRSIRTMKEGKISVTACIYDTVNFRKTGKAEMFNELRRKFPSVGEAVSLGYENVPSADVRYTVDKKPATGGSTGTAISGTEKIKRTTVNGQRRITLDRISPSVLQNMMECSWKFFYYYEYFDSEPKEREVGTWMTADKKGLFYHEVLQRYCEEELAEGKVGGCFNVSFDQGVFNRIFGAVVEKYEMIVPKGSEQAYEVEKKKSREELEEYLKLTCKELRIDPDRNWYVKECEKTVDTTPFFIGEDGKEINNPEDQDAIEVSFSGRLDRMDAYRDRSGVEHYRVIDYKTGKKKSTEDKIKTNTELQHTIYPATISGDVETFQYHFPCDGNDRTVKAGAEIKKLPEACLERLADVFLRNMALVPEKEKDACKWCDYKAICIHKMNLEG